MIPGLNRFGMEALIYQTIFAGLGLTAAQRHNDIAMAICLGMVFALMIVGVRHGTTK